jgi:hypothetical protein
MFLVNRSTAPDTVGVTAAVMEVMSRVTVPVMDRVVE